MTQTPRKGKLKCESASLLPRVLRRLSTPKPHPISGSPKAAGGYSAPTTIEWVFKPLSDGTTFVSITNAGFSGENAVREAISSTEGFSFVLAGAKAYLEYGIHLNLVGDRFPAGLET